MKADIHVLFHSRTVSVLDFHCREEQGSVSPVEYCDDFAISFTRSGTYSVRSDSGWAEVDSRVLLFTNAETERVVHHPNAGCDQCTILQWPRLLLEEAERIFRRKGVLPDRGSRFPFPVAAMLSTPGLDLLHGRMFAALSSPSPAERLRVENLSLKILESIYRQLYQWNPNDPVNDVGNRLRSQHLQTVERAKAYMLERLNEDISLRDISRKAFVSEFHFSRIFKQLTGHSPYQYLLQARLDNATLLLRDTRMPVTEVAFESGFSSFPHFIATFSSRFGISPLQYRRKSQ